MKHIDKMKFTKEEETKELLKSEKTKHERKPKIAPDPKKMEEMEGFKNSMLTLSKNMNCLKQEITNYYTQELTNIATHISAQNRIAARSNGTSHWVEVTGFDIKIQSWGSVNVIILGRWSNKKEFDENLSEEHFCQKTLDKIAEKFKIKISYPYYYFGK